MKKARNDQFFSNLEKFVNKVYPNQPQRQPYLNLKSWPSPRDEAWKFSRLGKLARKNILPLNFLTKPPERIFINPARQIS